MPDRVTQAAGPDEGVVYVASMDDDYVDQAFLSADSIKQAMPHCPVSLFTDRVDHALLALGVFDHVVPIAGQRPVGLSWAQGQLNRVRALPETPYRRTIHLDTDTRCTTTSLAPIFAMLRDVDIAMVEAHDDDSLSRRTLGTPMFNAGFIAYRRTAGVWDLLRRWGALTAEHVAIADRSPLASVDMLDHIAHEPTRRRLLYMDQISLCALLRPGGNDFGLSVRCLDYSWNHRGSPDPARNTQPLRIAHLPAYKAVTNADLMLFARRHRLAGRPSVAEQVERHVAEKRRRGKG